ncbi:DNA polymerase, partial [Klebsiella pneumoniae]
VILFEKLELPVIKKTKTGYSTNADVLEKLRDKHEIIDKITEYRQIVKLNSTYVEGLSNIINPISGRIHSSFNQTITTTGRISSTEPNLQNIPVKTEMGREIRKVFIADENSKLVDADYSQVELRV